MTVTMCVVVVRVTSTLTARQRRLLPCLVFVGVGRFVLDCRCAVGLVRLL